jgi:hypothetical protein
MRAIGLVAVGILVLIVVLPSGMATTTSVVTGVASACSNLGSCSFKLSNASGTGSAYTYPPSAYLRLPGDANTSSGQFRYATISHNTTNYYQQGTFVAVDVNSGHVVFGKTFTNVTVTTHCSRTGCYSFYALRNGSIALQVSSLWGTRVLLSCSPSAVRASHSTLCTASVAPYAKIVKVPRGNVTFGDYSYSVYGTFSHKGVCTLSNGTCSVKFTVSDDSTGYCAIFAKYGGSSAFYTSSASGSITVKSGG